jgi:drug/metabolite transporter (DMT)-like permease
MLSARLLILSAAVLWSTAGALIKLSTLSGWQLAGGRSIVAALTLWLVVSEARQRPSPVVLRVAVAYAATVVLFVLANKLTTAANAIFIQDCAPLYVLLLAPRILGERPSRTELLSAPVFAAGMLLFFFDQLSMGQLAGNGVALLSGVAFAFCIMGMRYIRHSGADAAAAWGNLLAFMVAAPFMFSGPPPTLQDLWVVLFLGVFQLGAAYALFARGLRHVSAAEASLLVLLEPVLNALWAFLFAGEQPGPFAVVGGAIVLLATLLRTAASVHSAKEQRVVS